MANNSGFILVDASEATSMAETARNALRSRGGEGGNMPQRMDAMVKDLQANAKRQQELAAKELAESKKLGSTITEVLEAVKRMKKDIGDTLNDQKKIAENTLKKAAEASIAPKKAAPGRGRSVAQEDTGAAYDTGSFKKAAKDIGGMMGPAGAANDMIDDMRTGFDKVRKSANALGVELYGHSVLPEIQKHLQGIIEQLATIKKDEDLLHATAASASGNIGGGINQEALKQAITEGNKALVDALTNDHSKLIQTIIDQQNDIQATMITGIGMAGGEGKGGGGGGGGLENITQAGFQDEVFKAFRKDLLLGLKGGLDTFMGLQIPVAIKNIQQLNKEVNNLQGGMAGTVAEARTYRIELTDALQGIILQNGFTIEQVGSATTAIMGLGVSGAKSISKQTDVMLMGSRALGVEVGDVAQTYGLAARNLRMSVDETRQMIQGTIKVAQQTGMTAKNVMEIRKEMQGFVDELRRAGPLSAQLTNQMTKAQVAANQLGLGNFQQDFQRQFLDATKLGQVSDEFGMLAVLTRGEMDKIGYSMSDIITGSFATSLQGQRDFAKATKTALERMKSMAGGSVVALQTISGGLFRSFEEIDRAITLQVRTSESQAERMERLIGVSDQLSQMRAAGFNVDEQALMKATGESSIKTQEDLTAAIAEARGNIANDAQDLAADVMKRTTEEAISLMNNNAMSAVEAREAAFDKAMRNAGPLLEGKTFMDIQRLSEQANQRAIDEELKNAEAATDNMVDRVSQGVQRGIQLVTGPFSDLVSFFDSMGVGPFVAGVALFGTAALMLVSSIKGLTALLGMNNITKSIGGFLSGTSGGSAEMAAASGATVATGASAATKVAQSGKEAIGTAAVTSQTAKTLSTYIVSIGDAGRELWKQLPGLMKGLAAITAVGLAIGGSILLMSQVYPEVGVVMGTTASITASVLAMGVLAGAMYGFQYISKIVNQTKAGLKEAAIALGILTVAGIAIGLAMRLLILAFPDPGDTLTLALGIGATALALTVLTGALFAFIGAGLIIAALAAGPQGAIALAAVVIAIVALTAVAYAMGQAMSALIEIFPESSETIKVAQTIAASGLAFGALAGAFLGLVTVGFMTMLPALTGPLGAIALGGSIAVGIAVLAGTAVLLANGINELHGMFSNPEEVEKTAKTIEAAAGAYDKLSSAFVKLVAIGTLTAGIPYASITRILPVVALNVLSEFAKDMNETLVKVQNNFQSQEEISKTAKTIELASGAIISLGEAYKGAVEAANLSWWKAGIDLYMNTLAVSSLFAFGMALVPYMYTLKSTYGQLEGLDEVAKRVKSSAEAIGALAEAGTLLAQYKKETDGWFFDIGPEELIGTMDDLVKISEAMAAHLPTIAANAPDPSVSSQLTSYGNAMKGLSEIMTTILQMQRDIGDNQWFGDSPLEKMDTFMVDLGNRLGNTDGGFHKLLLGIDNMPQFREDQVEKLGSMNKTIKSVFDVLKTLLDINNTIPNKAMFKTDMKDINTTLDNTVGVFTNNVDSLNALKAILIQVPKDLGENAVALSTAFGSIKNILLNVHDIAGEFPSGSDRSLEIINGHIRHIANNLDKDAIQKISDSFSGVDVTMPAKIDSLAGGIGRLPNLLTQVQRFAGMFSESDLKQVRDDIQAIADALAPLSDLAEALTFDAPNIEYFEREIANLILTLGAAANKIPQVLELRSEIDAQLNGRATIGSVESLNEALTDGPGAGNTLSTMADINTAMMDSGSSAGPSMGGAESRLDKLINAQEETNNLMRQLLTALTAPASRIGQTASGVAPKRTFPRAGSIRQNVDSAWNSAPELTT